MRISKRAVDNLRNYKQRRESGLVNVIPSPFKRMSWYTPGVQRKNYVIITASSGVGKSKFVKHAYVLNPYEYVNSHLDTGIKIKIFYFCLEEAKENFIHSIISHRLYVKHGIRIHIKDLKSMREEYILESSVLKYIDEMSPWLEEFEDSVEIVDQVRNPYGIFRTVEDYLKTVGTWKTKTINIGGQQHNVRDFWVPSDSERYVLVVVDNLNLLQPEKGQSGLWDAIVKFSSTYSLELRDKYFCSLAYVQQQEAAKEKQEYYKGQSIEAKLEPSLDGLGDCKLTQRDADEVFGLFAPNRYGISTHPSGGYNIDLLTDNYRSWMILKSRDGESNKRVGMWFDGATGYFEELPRVKEMDRNKYAALLSRVGRSTSQGRTLTF